MTVLEMSDATMTTRRITLDLFAQDDYEAPVVLDLTTGCATTMTIMKMLELIDAMMLPQ